MFRIGEFARLGSVSVASLRYYHARGVLVPVVVDPVTGYRWYSAAQLTSLCRIVALKELGFTLDQIERVVAEVTVDELRGMLVLRRAQIESDIGAGQDRLARVEARLRAMEREGEMPGFEITVKELPARHVAVLGGRPASWESDDLRAVLEPAYAELVDLLAEHHIEPAGPPFDFYEGDPEQDYFAAYAAVPGAESVAVVSPPARVADLPVVESALSVIVADVRLETFGEVYGAFARWAEEHGAELVGTPREGLVTRDRPADNRDVVLELVQPIRLPGAEARVITPTWQPVEVRDELAPALRSMPGLVSALLLTAYEHGRGVAVVVFETRDQAEQLTGGIGEGQEIRAGVVVTRTDILEVSAAA